MKLRALYAALFVAASCSASAAFAQEAPVEAPVEVPKEIEAAAAQATDIHDIHGAIERPAFPTGLALGFGAVAGGGALAWWLVRRKKNAKPLTADELAHAQLLAARRHIERDQPREYAIEVSDAVRAYLESAHGLSAPWRTTEEFLSELLGRDNMLPLERESLGRFLTACDLAKFARAELARPEMEKLHLAAIEVVESKHAARTTT